MNQKKIILILVWLTGIMALLVFSTGLFLQSRTFQTILLKQINQGIPGQLSWKDLSVSLFSGTVSIKDIVLKGEDQAMILKVPELSLCLSWKNLAAGQILLSSVFIDSPVVDLDISQQGQVNIVSAFVLPGPPEKPETPFVLPVNIRADKIMLANAAIGLKMADPVMHASVSGFDLSINNLDLIKQSANVTSRMGQGLIRHKDLSIEISPFSFQADVLGQQLSHLLVQTGLNGSHVEIQGRAEALFTEPILDLTLKTRIDFDTLKKSVQTLSLPTGTALVEASVKGPVSNPDALFSLTFGPGKFGGLPIDAVLVKSVLKDRVLTLLPSRFESGLESGFGNLFLDGKLNLQTAFPDGFTSGKQDLDQVLFQFNIRQEGMELSRAAGAGLKGRVSSLVTLNGRGVVPEKMETSVSADIQALQFAYQSLPPASPLDIRAQTRTFIKGDRMELHSLGIHSQGVDLTGKGRLEMPGFDLDALAVSGHLNLDARDLVWLEHLTRLPSQGQVQMTAELDGSVFRPEIILDAAAKDLKIDPVLAGSLQVSARLDKTGRVHIDQAVAERQGALVTARGRMDLFDRGFSLKPVTPMDIGMTFDKLEIGKFLPDQNLDGIFSGTIDLTGTPAEPSARATVQAKKIFVQQTRIGDAAVQMEFSSGVLTLHDAWVENKNSRVDVHGRIILNKPDSNETAAGPDMDLTLAADTVFLEDFSDDMKGKISFNGQIKGTVEQPAGNISFRGNHLDIRGQSLEKVRAAAVIRDKTVEINEMEILVSQGTKASATGKVLLPQGILDIRMTARDFDLTRIHAVPKEVIQSALVSLDLTARGKIDNPLVNGKVQVSRIKVFQGPAPPIDLALELENRQIRVKGSIGPDVDGTYDLITREFSAVLTMESLLLDPYLKLAGQPDASGRMTGVIHAQGRADKPDDITAGADISSLAISWENQPFLQVRPTTAAYADRGLALAPTRIDFVNGGSLTVTGQGFLDRDLDFEAKGAFPLKIISPLVKSMNTASGTIQVTASLKGSIKDPLVHADLMFDDLAMTLDDLEQEFTHISGHIRATPQKVEILGFTGQLDQGEFDLGGSIGIVSGSFEQLDLTLNTRRLTLDFPDLMDLTLNSSLHLFGTREKSDLTGEIVLLEGRYYRDVKLDLIAAATQKTRKIDPISQEAKNPFLDSIALNVRVSRHEPLLVENNLAYLLVSPDLTIRGTAHRPLLSGRATVDSGTISFQKSEFEVKKGIIDFVNPYEIEPIIDIEGEMKIRTWTITLAVSGTPDNLDLKFSSDPSESQADIISLIAFGKTAQELGQAQGSGQAASGKIVSGLLADAFQKDLQAATGLDQLEINMEDRANSGSQGVNVTVGKELSRQMGITYGVDTREGETVQRVTTYYKILENFIASGFQDSGGKFGTELKYRLEFR